MFTEHAFKVRFGSMLKTITGFHLGGLVSHPEGEGIDYIKKGAKVTQKFKIRIALTPGTYFLNCGVVALIDGEEIYLHRLIDAIMFKVQPEENIPFTGFVNLSSGIAEMDMLMES